MPSGLRRAMLIWCHLLAQHYMLDKEMENLVWVGNLTT